MASRGSQAWRDNISLAKRQAARERRDDATTVGEYETLLNHIRAGETPNEEKTAAERMRTIDFETMAPLDIVVTRRFGDGGGA